MSEVLRREIELDCGPERAFRTFVEHIDLWWPRGHRKSESGVLHFEPGSSGRIVEIAPGGDAWTMAAVRAYEPPHRLALDWFPGSPQAPTQVDISFAGSDNATLVTIVHQALPAAAQEVWPQRVAQFERGWDAAMTALRDHIALGGKTNG